MLELPIAAAATAGIGWLSHFCDEPTPKQQRAHKRVLLVHSPYHHKLSHIQASLESRLSRMGIQGENKYSQYLSRPHWKQFKAIVKAARPAICVACGTRKNILLHHRIYDRIGKERISDVVWLCKSHHNETHGIEHHTGDLLHAHQVLWLNRKRSGLKVGPWY